MEKRKRIPRKRLSPAVVWCCVIAVGVGTALAIQLAVKVSTVQLFAKKSGMSKVVAQVDQGTQLDVLATEGDWIKVRAPGGGEAYVKKDALNKPPLNAAGRPVPGTAGSSGVQTSLAGKGITGTEKAAGEYAGQQHFPPAAVNALNRQIDLTNSITPEEYEAFLQTGRIGQK